MLKALAVRLDAGIGTDREHAMFNAGLAEYKANGERIRAALRAETERKALLRAKMDVSEPPSWWEKQALPEYRREMWGKFSEEYRRQVIAAGPIAYAQQTCARLS